MLAARRHFPYQVGVVVLAHGLHQHRNSLRYRSKNASRLRLCQSKSWFFCINKLLIFHNL